MLRLLWRNNPTTKYESFSSQDEKKLSVGKDFIIIIIFFFYISASFNLLRETRFLTPSHREDRTQGDTIHQL